MSGADRNANTESDIIRSRTLTPGSDHYRAYVGPPQQFDFMGATQFALTFMLGLREEHRLLDVGCGSLRAGRFLIQYLLPGRYFGIEPNEWLWRDMIDKEIGSDLLALKRPTFSATSDFAFDTFDTTFDMIVAQSIFSHTGIDLLKHALQEAGKVLSDEGQFLFTAIVEGTPGFEKALNGMACRGWVYPGCVTFREPDVASLCRDYGLLVQKLPWFHPRQQWFRAVRQETLLLADPERAFRDGRTLFDPRFSDGAVPPVHAKGRSDKR